MAEHPGEKDAMLPRPLPRLWEVLEEHLGTVRQK